MLYIELPTREKITKLAEIECDDGFRTCQANIQIDFLKPSLGYAI